MNREGEKMTNDNETLKPIDPDYVPTQTIFEAWLEYANNGKLEGRAGFTMYAFADRLALLPGWYGGDPVVFELVKEAVKRWEDTGAIPPELDWRYWESHSGLPPFLVVKNGTKQRMQK